MDLCPFKRAILGLTTTKSKPEEVTPRASLIVFPETKPGPESFLTATFTHPRASTVRPAAGLREKRTFMKTTANSTADPEPSTQTADLAEFSQEQYRGDPMSKIASTETVSVLSRYTTAMAVVIGPTPRQLLVTGQTTSRERRLSAPIDTWKRTAYENS
jgi:hypothetical protein